MRPMPEPAPEWAPELSRLSLNQITADQLSMGEVVEGCTRAGIERVGAWRHKLEPGAGDLIRSAGLRVSSLCRGGFFPAATEAERREREADNRRALEEAAELGTDVLVLVCGGAPGPRLEEARAMVAEGIDRLVPHARECGVALAIEPLHPMMVVERSVIVTLGQALDLAERFDPGEVGVVVDAYHVWWDPRLEGEIERARERILGYHVSDWLVPTTDLLAGRGMMGEGAIDLPRLRGLVDRAGYRGPIEVEVINPALAGIPGDELIARVRESYLAHA
jgi:sugar phosphate isomerase/epimerase